MDARHGPLGKIMKPKWFIRYTAGCTKWDHKQNEEIMEKLKTESVLQNTGKHRQNWRDHVNGTGRQRNTQQILQYMPQGKRSIECLAKQMAQDHNRSHGLTQFWNMTINI
jgi:hypothetical protein